MNKQKAIEKIKNLNARETFMSEIIWVKRDDVLDIIKQLDEQQPQMDKPEKPVVPQFVANWYEENKDDFENGIYDFFVEFYEYEYKRNLSTELYQWFKLDGNKPIETLVMMHKFGYEVEKEKLYIAKNKQTGEYLCYCFEFFHDKNNSSENQRFTAEAKRWEELACWGNGLYDFEEVEGED